MKFPVSVTAKKPSNRHSTNDENDINRANVIYPSDDTKTSLFNLQPSKLSESTTTTASTFTTTTNTTTDMVCVTRGPEVVHQPKQEAVSESTETVVDDTAEAVMERRTSLADEGIDCRVGSFDYDSEQVSTRPSSRSSSIYDDSGFNSSASDDRDDISESLMNVNYDCDYEDEIEENEVQDKNDRTTHSVFNSFVESDRLGVVVEESSVDTSVNKKDSVNSSSEIDFTRELKLNTDSLLSKNSRIELSSTDVLVNNITRNSRRQRAVQADSTPTVTPTARTRTRRHRTKDQNNNVSTSNLRSHLGKPPFRLVDGFQDRGFLSFVACIVYTLMLVIICGAFGAFAESLKSLVGKSELKEIRNSIVQSRATRSPVSSG